MDHHFAIYTSHATIAASPARHNDILDVSQRNNRLLGVTGFLLREENYFLQFLEGPKPGLTKLLDRIRMDSRHKNMRIRRTGTAHRTFMPDWQMGFVDRRQVSLDGYLRIGDNDLDLGSADPFELVTYLAAQAAAMRFRHVAA